MKMKHSLGTVTVAALGLASLPALAQAQEGPVWDVYGQLNFGECPIFCVIAIWSMLPERSKDDDHIRGTAGRTTEGLRAA
ncbi:hypothetical protein LCGC14_0188650 [marine sediment metagenome]|jgi:hypothetical protein|uniref:Uncharacterized protein n=1 Tax=marine sediment metagenome TaxID=412755 RepID=A0A0F9V3H0_9ZZZZ|nr:hypothetical protein [Sulfitobacter litoralis]